MTITGNCILDRGIEPRGEQMLAVAEKYMLRKTADRPAVTPPGSYLSDDSVISKASAAVNGEKFSKDFYCFSFRGSGSLDLKGVQYAICFN